MPSHYAHLIFGKKVRAAAPADLRELFDRQETLFLTGLHGPDLLFYYRPISPNPVNREGSAIHSRPGSVFFRQGLQVLAQQNTTARRAYLAGALCHYMLDSACHPCVNHYQAAYQVGHHEIETELDRALMEQDGLDPFQVDVAAHIHPTAEVCRTIAPFYPTVSPKQLHSAMAAMKKLCRLARTRSAPLRAGVFAGMNLVGVKAFQGIFLLPQPRPSCRESTRRLLPLLEETVAPTVVQLERLFSSAQDLDPRLNLNFEGVAAT